MKTNKLEFNLMNNPVRSWIQKNIEIKSFPKSDKIKINNVLEIGCGNGYGTTLIKQKFHPNQIVGVDLDEKMIYKAKRRKLPNTKFEIGDIAKLKYSSNSFDAIFDFGVIHHISNWEESLSEIYRVLAIGGQFFVEDFSIESFNSPLGILFKKFFDHPYTSMYTFEEFISYSKRIGYKVKYLRRKNPLNLISYFVVVLEK